MAASDAVKARTYGNWRVPRSAGIVGLGSVGTAVLLGGMIVTVLVVMASTLLHGVIVASVLALLFTVVVIRDKHGMSVLSRLSGRVGWWLARSAGQNLYRSGPLGWSRWGTHQLPGLAAGIRVSEHQDPYGRPFALLYVPATRTYSVVIGTDPDGAALVDPDQIDTWVADWGHWLAMLADEPGLQGASVTIETAPDSGSRLRREVESNLDPNAPEFARQVLADTVTEFPAGASQVSAYVTLTFGSAGSDGRKRSPVEAAAEVAPRLPGLTAALQSTGAGASHPLSATRLCEVVRTAYDPEAANTIDAAGSRGEATELRWPDVGPVAHQAGWGCYRHDGGWSQSWVMTAAPRGHVQSGILSRLLAPNHKITRKRVTLLYRPVDPGRAATLVESDLRAAEFRSSGSSKTSARDGLAVRQAQATAREEAAGAALINFGAIITATVTDERRRSEVRATVDSLVSSARLRVRPAYGSQDSAFAAGLPLGLVLPKHLRMPTELREDL